ncbi:MAG: O-antigen ligase family protein [Flavobacteriales bacterium]|nr:O-antigen ligase family protein [Flavobacteriales bacterium]
MDAQAVSTLKNRLYITAAIFIALMGVSIYFEFFYFALLPLALLVGWMAFYRLEMLLICVVACVPFSINLEDLGIGGVGMYLPTEPMLFGITLLAIIKLLSNHHIDRRIFTHPVSIILYIYLTWMSLTAITSELPIVSFKFIVAKLWFIIPYYFLGVHLFLNEKYRKWFKLAYLFPLFAVIIYTVTRHASYGFDKDSSHWVMEPLFKDHTSYGAVLAMFFPVLSALLIQKKMGPALRFFLILGMVILITGIVFSYTRAAWLSIFGAAAVLAILMIKIQLRTVLLALAVVGGIVFAGWEDIQVSLERNKQESSDRLEEHITSVSNVSSDASNLERLNRWNCALEMFAERPLFGWGPGTYQFVYAPFQRAKDRTIISTNEGDGGNAHSEYLGPLSEQGLPGMLIVLVLVYTVCSLGFKLHYQIRDKEQRMLMTSVFLGLMTYFIHGTLNNYLDTDKASVPFWGFIDMMVAADLTLRREQDAETKSTPAGAQTL